MHSRPRHKHCSRRNSAAAHRPHFPHHCRQSYLEDFHGEDACLGDHAGNRPSQQPAVHIRVMEIVLIVQQPFCLPEDDG